jgi:hypothetical protein
MVPAFRLLFLTFFLITINYISVFSNIKTNHKQGFNAESVNSTIIVPRVYKPLEFKCAVSVLFTRLPLDWIETSVDVPIVQLTGKLGLPAGFTVESSFQSIYVSNQLRMGPHWNYQLKRLSFGVGLDAALLLGKMEIDGFNNKALGWSYYPNISIGIRTKEVAFTIAAEYNLLRFFKITSGDAEISRSKNFKSGQTISLYMEQKLWKNHIMILGLINNFHKFYYLAWPAFSTFNRRYYIPQIYLGLVL